MEIFLKAHIFVFHKNTLFTLYFAFVRSELQYASVGWNYIPITDSNKLECKKEKFSAFSYGRISQNIQYELDYLLEKFKFKDLAYEASSLKPFFLTT